MESWSYVSGEKVCVSDSVGKTRSSSLGNNMFISGQQQVTETSFEDLDKQLTNDSFGGVLSSNGSGGSSINPIMSTLNCFSDASTSKVSSSWVDSRDSSFIDLKLGRFGDHNFSKGGPILTSSESSTPPKRVRSTVLTSQTAYCQVYGCNKDLSSSKDYHKRHKVCEVHAKTAKVIVNGIQQRFCQQCSRFHLLAEFDEGKRSCRKRLAGHNERRRKPQVGFHSGRNGKLLHSYNDGSSRFQGSMLSTPFGVLNPEKYAMNDWYKRVKAEDGTDFGLLPAIPMSNGHFQSKSLFPSSDFDRSFPPFHENSGLTSNGSILTENSARYWPNSGSQPPFQYPPSLGNEDLNVYFQGLSGMSETGCALSLLSPQSQDNSSSRFTMSQVSENLVGVTSQASTSAVSKNFSSGMNSAETSHLSPLLMSDGSEAASFHIGNYQSGFVNAEERLSHEEVPTIDLLQLSSQLQRVEHLRQSMQVEQDNDTSFCLRIT